MLDIIDDTKGLYRHIQIAKERLKKTTDPDEKMCLRVYIETIYSAIQNVQERDLCKSNRDIFGSYKNLKKIIYKQNQYESEMIDNYIDNKEFISDYMGKIARGVDKLKPNDSESYTSYELLSIDDFWDIFYQFMKSIHLDEFFDEYINNSHIYNCCSDDNVPGWMIVDPINNNYDIFLDFLIPNIYSLLVLAHEFGHVYDFNEHNVDAKTFNKSMFQSFNGEVFSCLFERLFLDFLNNNNILEDDFERMKISTMKAQYNYLVSSYILSLLKDSYLENLDFTYMSNEEIYYIVKNKLKIDFDSIIEYMLPFDLTENNAYAFGDVFSMFLFDRIKEEGFNNELVSKFVNERYKMFNKDFIIDNGLSSDNYLELYKKELKLLKK